MSKKILLLVCCAPDATHSIDVLREEGYEVTTYFYNPCVHPKQEYIKRFAAMMKLASKTKTNNIKDVEYDTDRWFSLAESLKDEPEGGKRCEVCFRMRLEQAARKARELKLPEFATTLTISPHKDAALINKLGKEAGEKFKVRYYESDFKKKDGFKKSIELSKKYELYRQNYCGCEYSINE